MSDPLEAETGVPGEVVAVVRRIAAPPDVVFSYLVDPARFILWMGVAAELDARPGGDYQIRVGPDSVASGQYQIVEAPHRLVFTWGWRGDPDVPAGSTRVEILLSQDQGGTLLELRHTGLPGQESRVSHSEGWRLYLGQLVELIGR